MLARLPQGYESGKFVRWNEYEVPPTKTSDVKITILSTYGNEAKGFQDIEVFIGSSKCRKWQYKIYTFNL